MLGIKVGKEEVMKEKNGVTPLFKEGVAHNVTVASGTIVVHKEGDSDTITGLVQNQMDCCLQRSSMDGLDAMLENGSMSKSSYARAMDELSAGSGVER
ncbi:hypothetical protein Tco_0403770 [Tanacetum coccineum]